LLELRPQTRRALVKTNDPINATQKPHEIIVVAGPTAIGKTKLAIDLANYWDCNIISADSRQFYKEMTIGTAVPSKEELSAAPHHLIQHKSIHEAYSVGDFEREALSLISRFSENKDKTVVVGGSGLYINALLYGLDEFPEVPNAVRTQLNQEFKANGLIWLQEELKKVDPAYFNQVDIMNPQRIIRALEIYRSSGIAFSTLRTDKVKKRPFKYTLIGLTAPRAEIYERINQRVDHMITDGLVQEAQELYPYRELNALQTVGYREIFDHLDKKSSLESAIELIKQNTRRFSKRQMTWFNKNEELHWFERENALSEILEFCFSLNH